MEINELLGATSEAPKDQGGLGCTVQQQRRSKAVMCPRWGIDSASGHPRAQQPPLERVTPLRHVVKLTLLCLHSVVLISV